MRPTNISRTTAPSIFRPARLPESQEYTISLYSFSKAYGFASWRIGYAVMPEHLLVATKKEQDTILICPPVISQVAACAALRVGSEYCRQRIAGFAQVRSIIRQELATIESFCHVPPTAGALYYLLKVDTKLDDMTVVTRLVKEFGVAVLPGGTFGIDTGCTLRLSFGALDAESVAEGAHRLVRGLTSDRGEMNMQVIGVPIRYRLGKQAGQFRPCAFAVEKLRAWNRGH